MAGGKKIRTPLVAQDSFFYRGGQSLFQGHAVDIVVDLIKNNRFADAKVLCDLLDFDFAVIFLQDSRFCVKWKAADVD